MNIETFLETEKAKSQRVVAVWLKHQRVLWNDLGIPMKVMLLNLTDYSLRGGKWARPTLTRLAYQLMGGKINPGIMRVSVVNELMHRYILVHDDIVDRDLTRHHGLTLEAVYGERFKRKFPYGQESNYAMGMSMIGGDLLNALLQMWVLTSGLNQKTAQAYLMGINQMLVETVAGWLLETDLKYTPLKLVKLKEVERAMLLVSAQYSVLWPLRLGQVLGGRIFGDWQEELEVYGREVGLAFQLTDDILGIFGDEAVTGKPVGNDLREGKKSWLLVKTYQQVSASERTVLHQALLQPIEKKTLKQVREIIERSGVLKETKALALSKALKGIKAIERIEGEAQAKQRLIELANFLADRQF